MVGGVDIKGGDGRAHIAHHAVRLRTIVSARIAQWRAAEEGRAMLWAPVAFGAGAALHLSARSEPSLLLAIAALVAAFPIFARTRAPLALLAGLIAAGALVSEMRVRAVAAPVLVRETGIGGISGRILSVEDGVGQKRIVLALAAVEGVEADALPARARLMARRRVRGGSRR